MQQLEDRLANDKQDSINTFQAVKDDQKAESDKVQEQIQLIQSEARTDKNNLDKTAADLAIVTMRLNQQQEELALSQEY